MSEHNKEKSCLEMGADCPVCFPKSDPYECVFIQSENSLECYQCGESKEKHGQSARVAGSTAKARAAIAKAEGK